MTRFDVAKQFQFAMAQTLTTLAKESVPAVNADIRTTFTPRGSWLNSGNAMNIKALPASRNDLESAVVTRADWLTLHEDGGTKIPRGAHVAVPTRNVRRNKRDIIQRSQRPANLKRSFVLKSRKQGLDIIFQRRGRKGKSEIVAMYKLIPRAQIDKNSTITEQTMKVVEKNFDQLLFVKLAHAIKTAR